MADLAARITQMRERLTEEEDPALALELAMLEYMGGDFEAARQDAEAAFRGWKAAGQRRQAARVATVIGRILHEGFGHERAAAGWFSRGRSLLEDEGPCVELGWLELGLVGCAFADAQDLEQRARRARAIAREFADADLECKALADLGLALVSMGRVTEGMSRLDEALTLVASREVVNPFVAGEATCSLVSACERVGDYRPADAWTSILGPPSAEDECLYLFCHCRVAYGRLLSDAGRWREAETALRLGIGAAELNRSAHFRSVSRAALADLRIRQGRLEEARRLLEGTDDLVETAHARALLHLARRQPELAAAVARQALRELHADCLRSPSLLLVLVDAELQRGDVAAATGAAERLEALEAETEVPLIRIHAALARGRVAARSDPASAAVAFERGLRAIESDNWPLLRAGLHLDLARALSRLDRPAAVVEARAALAIYERVGAPEVEDATALLRGLGVAIRGQAPAQGSGDVLSAREREVLALLGRGLSNPEIAEALVVSRKTVEHHVTSVLGKLGLRSRAEAAVYAVTLADRPNG